MRQNRPHIQDEGAFLQAFNSATLQATRQCFVSSCCALHASDKDARDYLQALIMSNHGVQVWGEQGRH